jgi:cell division protein FtsZ
MNMSIEIGPPLVDELKPRITVIGVGGAGGNAIANMIAAQVEGVDFIVANTDAQALNASSAERRIQLGPRITEGLGAGSRPEIGRAAAEETILSIEEALEGAHMCFIAAGMGGGTGTGAAPVIAKTAREKGILTVGVVTKPFTFEGTRRSRSADAGIEELQKHVDTLIVIPNQNLFLVANPNTTFKEAFQMADEVLQQGVRGITDLMVMPGLINLDFADVRSVMGEMGKAMMGTGEAEGDGRALAAAEKAIANPLLDGVSMQGAKGVIVSITGGEDMRLMEVDEAANHIRELVDPDANIIWGSAFNPDLEGKIRVSVVATGIDSDAVQAAAPQTQPFSFASKPQAAAASDVSFGQDVSSAGSAPSAPFAPPVGSAQEQDADEDAMDLAGSEAPVETAEHGTTDTISFPDTAGAPEPAPFAQSAPVARFDDIDGEDELLLGTEAALGQSAAQASQAAPPASPLVSKPAGGTLFERMSGLSRGLGKSSRTDDDDDDDEPSGVTNFPQFLNRQGNQ